MKFRIVALLIAGAGIVAVGIAEMKNVREIEQLKREAIEQDAKEQIRALWASAIEIQKRVQNGEYNNIEDLMNDFEFFTIANRNEDLNEDPQTD